MDSPRSPGLWRTIDTKFHCCLWPPGYVNFAIDKCSHAWYKPIDIIVNRGKGISFRRGGSMSTGVSHVFCSQEVVWNGRCRGDRRNPSGGFSPARSSRSDLGCGCRGRCCIHRVTMVGSVTPNLLMLLDQSKSSLLSDSSSA